ncbi:MAG: Uma2 family endonuclease [Armatimonadota bacterium]|nr:Uma2 family endonuclease [Armatimonadota bacterium]
MAVQTLPKKITYEEWLQMPETNQPYEVVDGEIRMSPAPNLLHQFLIGEIIALLREGVPKEQGVVLGSPVDIIVSRSLFKTRQLDIMLVLFRKDGWQNLQAVLEAPPGEVVPDLVIEVLSPSERRQTVEEKIEDYRRIGVREFWLVSPEAETVEVLRLGKEGIERIGLYGRGDAVRSELLPECHVDTNRLFA